jgi:hypothetical protein
LALVVGAHWDCSKASCGQGIPQFPAGPQQVYPCLDIEKSMDASDVAFALILKGLIVVVVIIFLSLLSFEPSRDTLASYEVFYFFFIEEK